MFDAVSATVEAFSQALQSISPNWIDRQRPTRRLLMADPLEKLVPVKLLNEGLGKLLKELDRPEEPMVLFMDRFGGGDGARAAAGLMPLLGEHWPGVSFVHIAFATPAQGMGTLIRGVVVHTGARYGVNVHVVAHNRPVEGLKLSTQDVDDLTGASDLVITFAPSGAAGFLRTEPESDKDQLLARSHLAVLSFTDPESLVASLGKLRRLVEKEPALDAVRFWVQIEIDGAFEDLGSAVLGSLGDADDRLWIMLDNARRHRYRILMEPTKGGLPCGDSLLCPCRSVIHEALDDLATAVRIVPAGSRLVVVARGADS